jgi:hypothetical protein
VLMVCGGGQPDFTVCALNEVAVQSWGHTKNNDYGESLSE